MQETAARTWRQVVDRVAGDFMDLVFPPQCVGCHDPLQHGCPRMWCGECVAALASDAERCCPKCGVENLKSRFQEGRCFLCRDRKFYFQRAISVGNYQGDMKQLVIQLKATLDDSLAFQCGRLMGAELERRLPGAVFDGLLPVPSHWWNRLKRPIHLTSVLTEGIKKESGFPILEKIIQCTRRTAKQGTLDTPARLQNVAGAFQMTNAAKVSGKRILVVDDVMTSGATVNQVAKSLVSSGVAEVVVLTLARGSRQS